MYNPAQVKVPIASFSGGKDWLADPTVSTRDAIRGKRTPVSVETSLPGVLVLNMAAPMIQYDRVAPLWSVLYLVADIRISQHGSPVVVSAACTWWQKWNCETCLLKSAASTLISALVMRPENVNLNDDVFAGCEVGGIPIAEHFLQRANRRLQPPGLHLGSQHRKQSVRESHSADAET